MGLWHGANWTFLLWGLYHAVLVYGQRRIQPLISGWSPATRALLGFAVTLPLSMLGWIPFRAENLSDALTMLRQVANPIAYFSLGLRENNYLVATCMLFLVLGAYATNRWVLPQIERHPITFVALRSVGYTVVIASVFIFLRPISQFIYFQF
jgi:D-alanyl-lipoteichoic acid acyltransferase DltB (MBOAT superfamily)